MHQQSIVHVIDFGLAKLYNDPQTQQHIRYREGKRPIGTSRFASIRTHLGIGKKANSCRYEPANTDLPTALLRAIASRRPGEPWLRADVLPAWQPTLAGDEGLRGRGEVGPRPGKMSIRAEVLCEGFLGEY
jgi:hypothetical protein